MDAGVVRIARPIAGGPLMAADAGRTLQIHQESITPLEVVTSTRIGVRPTTVSTLPRSGRATT
jgi:hypothetical protein